MSAPSSCSSCLFVVEWLLGTHFFYPPPSWRVFTAIKDETDQGRRLENASWRLQAMLRKGKHPAKRLSVDSLNENNGANNTLKLLRTDSHEGGAKIAPQATNLLSCALEHGLADKCMDQLLALLRTGGAKGECRSVGGWIILCRRRKSFLEVEEKDVDVVLGENKIKTAIVLVLIFTFSFRPPCARH